MYRKNFFLLVFAISFFNSSFSQDTNFTRPKNSISLNLIGNGSLVGLNFDRSFFLKENIFISTMIGFGFNEISEGFLNKNGGISCVTVPHQLTINMGIKRHFVEAGIGGTSVTGSNKIPYLVYPTVGYRLQPKQKNGFNMRIYGSLLLLETKSNYSILPDAGYIFFSPFGISIGTSF